MSDYPYDDEGTRRETNAQPFLPLPPIQLPQLPALPIPDFSAALRDTMIVAGQQKLQEKVQEQSWFQKYSNTATTIISGLSVFMVWAGGNEINLPDQVQLIIGAILVVAQVLGVKATKNGLTESTVQKTMNPPVMDTVAAEAEKLIAQQLEAAYRTDPNKILGLGEHRAQ